MASHTTTNLRRMFCKVLLLCTSSSWGAYNNYTHTHTYICFMRYTIFSSHFVGEGGWVGITLKCEYKKGGMQRAVSFQAHISKSFSPWNVWWVCIIYALCFTSLVSQHFTSFGWNIVFVAHPHIVSYSRLWKGFCIFDDDYGGGGVFALSQKFQHSFLCCLCFFH